MKRSIKLAIKPDWNDIENIRKEGSEFMRFHGLSESNVHSIITIISELVENSVKYGKFKAKKDKIIVLINIAENKIIVEVINPIDKTTKNHLQRLDKYIQWIRGYQDPFQAYIERLKIVSKKPLQNEESGLGLVRIAYEGKAILDFFASEDDTLNVSAISELDRNLGE